MDVEAPLPELSVLVERIMNCEIPHNKTIQVSNILVPFRKAMSYTIMHIEELVIAATRQLFWYNTIENYKTKTVLVTCETIQRNKLFHCSIIYPYLSRLQNIAANHIKRYQKLIGCHLGKFLEATHFDALIHGNYLREDAFDVITNIMDEIAVKEEETLISDVTNNADIERMIADLYHPHSGFDYECPDTNQTLETLTNWGM